MICTCCLANKNCIGTNNLSRVNLSIRLVRNWSGSKFTTKNGQTTIVVINFLNSEDFRIQLILLTNCKQWVTVCIGKVGQVHKCCTCTNCQLQRRQRSGVTVIQVNCFNLSNISTKVGNVFSVFKEIRIIDEIRLINESTETNCAGTNFFTLNHKNFKCSISIPTNDSENITSMVVSATLIQLQVDDTTFSIDTYINSHSSTRTTSYRYIISINVPITLSDSRSNRIDNANTEQQVGVEGNTFQLVGINDIQSICCATNNNSIITSLNTCYSVTNRRICTEDGAQIEGIDLFEVKTKLNILNTCRRLRRFSKYNLVSQNFISTSRCLNNTVHNNHQLRSCSNNLLLLNSQREGKLNTIKLVRNIIKTLNNGCQNLLRRSQSLLTEQNFSVSEISVDWFNQGKVLNVRYNSRICQVDGLNQFEINLFVFDSSCFGKTQLTKNLESSRVNVAGNNVSPLINGDRRLNAIGEVLIVVRVLNFLNDFRGFTSVIDKLTRSLGDRRNVQNTFSNLKVVNSTRRLGNCTSYVFANLEVANIVNNFKNLRTRLPTRVIGDVTKCGSIFQCIALINLLTSKELTDSDDCLCLTTKGCGKKNLSTSTSVDECQIVANSCVIGCQSKTHLVTFKTICDASDGIVCLTCYKRTECSNTECGVTVAIILNSQLNFSTVGNTMGEGELEEVQVEVNNIRECRVKGDCRFRRVTCTRVLNFDTFNTTVLDVSNRCSTNTAATFNNNSRCLGVSRTRVSNLDAFKNRRINQLQVDREGNLRTQSIVLRIIETKVIVLEFLNLTNLITLNKDGCSSTSRRNNNCQFTTRTLQTGTKDTRNCFNVDECISIVLTRGSDDYLTNLSRDELTFFVKTIFNGDLNETTFAITLNRNAEVCTQSIFRTRVCDLYSFNLTGGLNSTYNRKFLIESTTTDDTNRIDRTNRRCCTCRISGSFNISRTLRFNLEGELHCYCTASDCCTSKLLNRELTKIRGVLNIQICICRCRRLAINSGGVKVV